MLRNVKKLAAGTLCAVVLALPGSADKLELRVLYTGDPENDRTADFTRFLEEHFAHVGSTSYETFTAEDADGYDVVIFDWPTIYPRDENGEVLRDNFSLKMPGAPRLPADWDKPSILIGSAGQRLFDRRSKFDWL